MSDSTSSKAQAQMLDELYELVGLIEEPRDKDLIVEAKWLLEAQFRVIIAACEKYNDTIASWEKYVNETAVPRVVAFLREKLASDQALMGTVVQDVMNTLQKKSESDKVRLKKIEENIQLLGGIL
jgi:hypothetical protein